MDHLMYDGVFHFARGEVVALAYPQFVVVVLTLAEEPPAALAGELSDVRCRVSQYNRDTRQRTVEDESVGGPRKKPESVLNEISCPRVIFPSKIM